LWPLVVAASAGAGWILTAAYARGLGIPVRTLDLAIVAYATISGTVLTVWALMGLFGSERGWVR
jgi:hypothetical protein